MMPSSLSRIFGWAPPSDEDFLDVEVPEQPLAYQLPAFHMAHNSAMEPGSPASSVSALSDSNQDRRAEVARKGDPTWVARPRNEFILFRCDYVRKHTKEGGKRSRKQPGQEVEKTLSKLAAEAWRALSTEERAYWREQANLERTNHARKYPDYRYRPKKSATARKRQSRSSMSAFVVTKSIPTPALLDRVTVDAISRSPPHEPPMPMIERTGNLYLDNGSNGNSLRKSTSFPVLPSSVRRRDWLSPSLQPIQSSYDPRMNSTRISTYHHALHPSLQHSQSYDSIGLNTPALSESMSIPESTTSSLINWNGEPTILSPQPSPYMNALSLPIHSFPSSESVNLPHKYLNAVSGGYPSVQHMNDSRPPPIPTHFRQQQQQQQHQHHHHGLFTDTHWVPGAYQPIMRTPSGQDLREQFISSSSVYGSYRHQDIEIPPVIGVVPGEHLAASSAEMTPDEVFVMDKDYFPSY